MTPRHRPPISTLDHLGLETMNTTSTGKAHIVFAHPEPTSFNGHLAHITQKSLSSLAENPTLSDLYGEGFDPCEGPKHYSNRVDEQSFHPQTEQRNSAESGTIPMDVSREIDRIIECDILIVHFPLWWFGPPAILKGWMDRVFVYGRMYRSTMRYDTGICAGKRMMACVTTGSSKENCSFNGREGNTRLHLWPILYPFRYLGFDVLEPEIFHGVGSTAFMEGHEQGLSTLDAYSAQWNSVLSSLSDRPIVHFNRDSDFDEDKRLLPGAPSHSPFIQHEPWPD